MKNKPLVLFLLFSILLVVLWSLVNPKDRGTWVLESAPVFAGLGLLFYSYAKGFYFTSLSLVLIWLFAGILLVGGHYTYAEEPFFAMLQRAFGLERNYFDRLGHIFQGLAPSIVAREILLRKSPLVRGRWLFFLCVSVTMFISSVYEIIEWIVAAASESGAVEFLATQGDLFDAQKDMFFCLISAVLSLMVFSRLHDRQLAGI